MGKFGVEVIFANDRPLSLAGMEYVAGKANAINLVGVCRSSDTLIDSISRIHCDVVLIDYAIRGNGKREGMALLGYLRRTYPQVGMVVLVTHENPVIIQAILDLGVESLVSKLDDVGHIVTAIHACYGGGSYLSPQIKRSLASSGGDGRRPPLRLSPREIEVIRLYLSGMTINQIAGRLNRGKPTISSQKISAMKKLGVKGDVELVRYATCLDLTNERGADRFEIQ